MVRISQYRINPIKKPGGIAFYEQSLVKSIKSATITTNTFR